jgi:poly-gamma-glutamate capsule biosynthesis protein CapA/YwtB (metallophosphatase superfamily)
MQEFFTLSQNGDEQTFSTLLNQAFRNKGITVQCYRHDTCLYVVLLSAEAPQQSYCINLINNELNHFRTKLIKTVQVYGRQNNQADHLWTQTFELDEISHSCLGFTKTWFSNSSQQPETKAKKHTANLSFLLSFISCFLLGTSGLVAKAQPGSVIDNTPKAATTIDLQNLFTETNNQVVISTPVNKFNSKGKPDIPTEKDTKSISKSEKSETQPSNSQQSKLAENSKTTENNTKFVSKSEKSPQQLETEPLSSKQPKSAEKTKTTAKGKKSFSKSKKSTQLSKTKLSKAKSTEAKKLNKKKKSSKSTPKIKAKPDTPSESKTESLKTKPVSKSSSTTTSSSDSSLEKKVSNSQPTTQPFAAKPNKLSVTPKPTTQSSKTAKFTVPATSTPESPASQIQPQTSKTEKSTDTSEKANTSSKTKPTSKSLSKKKSNSNSEAIKKKLKPKPAAKSSQNQKSPNNLPAADKSSQPNSSWTPPTQDKSNKNPEPLPSVPSNPPKADPTSTPKSTSQPASPEKQPEKDAVKDSPKSQPTEVPSTEQKPVTTSPANSDENATSNPKSSKNDGDITIKAVGDIVPGTNFPNNRLPDKNKVFAKVKKSLDGADILFGNFESTFTNSSQVGKDTSRPMVFAFRTPPTFANVFKKTGFDILSVANNHSLDFSQVGFADTMKNINSAGMKAVGKKNEIVYKQVKNVPMAFIGFSFLDVHNSLNNLEAAKALVLEAKQNAKIVVISVHGGAEGTDAMRVKNQQENFYGENRGNLVLFARTMIDNGADLVLGHGPHVVRAMELYKGKMIAYSLGNFVGYRTLSTEGDLAKSMILQVKLNSKGNFVSGKILPVILDKQGLPYPDKQLRTVKLISQLTKSDFPNTDLAISRKGEIYKRFRTYRFFTLDFEGKQRPKFQA